MIHDSLVTLNIFDIDNKLLNKTTSPLLYYWNGESDILNDFRKDEQFVKAYETLFLTPQKYIEIMVSYVYFKYNDDGEEIFEEHTTDIQDIIYLDRFNSKHIVSYYLVNHFNELYRNSFKTNKELNDTDWETYIIEIYKAVKNKFKDRLSKQTIINWVRSLLLDKDHFNTHNTNIIIKELETILINEEV
jgi:hypothetical protein